MPRWCHHWLNDVSSSTDEIFDLQFRTISHSKRISHARSISHWSSPGGIVFDWSIVCTINVVFCVKYLELIKLWAGPQSGSASVQQINAFNVFLVHLLLTNSKLHSLSFLWRNIYLYSCNIVNFVENSFCLLWPLAHCLIVRNSSMSKMRP